ncbi:MAG: M48 family metallopeptidase [Clostridiales bacterium]|nr:M48 family metallopeptidase [Clostridiales bacterium]
MVFEYKLIRSKRKTAAIYIREGGVEVRAPLKMPKSAIDEFIAAKEGWIRDKLAKSREQTERRAAFTLDYGDTVLYCGASYPIAAKEGHRAGFDGRSFYMPPDLTPEGIKAVCVRIYRMLAKQYLSERALYFAERMGAALGAVKISGAKTRWGSCSSQKNINFSWRLIMADGELIDYVVIHELAHIFEMNHSARFWQIVQSVLPDYQERKARLKELQYRLGGEDWE